MCGFFVFVVVAVGGGGGPVLFLTLLEHWQNQDRIEFTDA